MSDEPTENELLRDLEAQVGLLPAEVTLTHDKRLIRVCSQLGNQLQILSERIDELILDLRNSPKS